MRNRRNRGLSFFQKINNWFIQNPHLAKWGTFIIAIISVIISIVLLNTKPQGLVNVEVNGSYGPITSFEECNEWGWFYKQEELYAFTFTNSGDKVITVTNARIEKTPKGNDNIEVSAWHTFFTSEDEYLSTINSFDKGMVAIGDVNLFDTKGITYSIPLVLEPGISKVFVIKIVVAITVKSGNSNDLIKYRLDNQDTGDWELTYAIAKNDGKVFVTPIYIPQIPVFRNFVQCPPAKE